MSAFGIISFSFFGRSGVGPISVSGLSVSDRLLLGDNEIQQTSSGDLSSLTCSIVVLRGA